MWSSHRYRARARAQRLGAFGELFTKTVYPAWAVFAQATRGSAENDQAGSVVGGQRGVRRREDGAAQEVELAAERGEERGVGGVAAGRDAQHGLPRREPGGVEDVPVAVDRGFEDGVEVHRREPGRVDAHVTRGDVEEPAQGDAD